MKKFYQRKNRIVFKAMLIAVLFFCIAVFYVNLNNNKMQKNHCCLAMAFLLQKLLDGLAYLLNKIFTIC